MSGQRLQIVDALRGFALAGVALVHVLEQYVAGPVPPGVYETVQNGVIDQIISGIVGTVFIGKFFALFSILFGLSYYIQMESAKSRQESFAGRFLWRSIILFGIGLIHQCFYRGDILTIYALLTPFLLPFNKLGTKWIIGMSLFCFASAFKLLSYTIWGDGLILAPHSFMDFDNEWISDYIGLLQNGSFTELAKANLDYGMTTKMDFQIGFMGRFYYTFGYFLVGVLLGRSGIFKNTDIFRDYRKKALIYTGVLILVSVILTAIFFSMAEQPIDWSNWLPVLGVNFSDWVNIAITALVLIGFISWYRSSKGEVLLNSFAPYGRMALTNYLLQSIIGTFIFFNWGLGLFATMRTYQLLIIAVVIIAIQMYISKLWLQHFRYGPLEWAWRSLTYMKIQKLKK